MTQEEIEQGFADAGWQLDGSFYERLIIGFTRELSILAYHPAWQTAEEPEFQLCDHKNDLQYWVKEIVTPQRAAQLLQEHGELVTED